MLLLHSLDAPVYDYSIEFSVNSMADDDDYQDMDNDDFVDDDVEDVDLEQGEDEQDDHRIDIISVRFLAELLEMLKWFFFF